MNPVHSELLIHIWYALILGGVKYWGELRFAGAVAGKKAWPRLYALYILTNWAIAAISILADAPDWLGLLAQGAALLTFSKASFQMRFVDALYPCLTVFTLNTFYEGFLALFLEPISGNLHIPGMAGRILVQLAVSALLAAALLAVYRILGTRYPIRHSAASRPYLLTLLLCSLMVWAVRSASYGDGALLARGNGFPMSASWMAISVIAFFSTVVACHHAGSLLTAEQEKAMMEGEIRTQRQNTGEAMRRYETYRAYQHDIRNHFLVLSGLLRRKEYSEMGQYLDKLTATVDATIEEPLTGRPSVDVLLNEKIRYAGNAGIEVELDFQANIGDAVDDLDLCTIFSNGLDNAITACKTLGGHRYIRISVRKKNAFYLIEMENSAASDGGSIVIGIGLKNIRMVAEKYAGTMKTEKAEGVFRLQVLLCIRCH
jgi:hypothetical protein